MPEGLKPYNPSQKGQELIVSFGSESLEVKEDHLFKHWQQNPEETTALLDVFHHIISSIVKERLDGNTENTLELSGNLLFELIKSMKEKDCFFSYEDGVAFFETLEQYKPSIFKNINQVNAAIKTFFPPKSKINPDFNFPKEYDDSVKAEVEKICKKTQDAFDEIIPFIKVMRRSNLIRERFGKHKEITSMDLEIAKESFNESSQNYMVHAKIIQEGMPYIHQAYLSFPKAMVLHQIYNKYLAKFICSKETKNPLENFVLNLADGDFVLELPNFELTKEEEQKGFTEVRKRTLYKEDLNLELKRLESRFRKRQLTQLLKKGKTRDSVIKELTQLSITDPDDIKTHIFLAKLLQDQLRASSNPIERLKLRERALVSCELAFSKIDVYMDLQGIENVRERDMIRVGFVKTISTIRIPLVKGMS
ncbi:MAG: hypothetical protein OEY59_10100 [Deltaproteobacteria bacterium]|nr:hypothetical protein [Deltaproteobacteria bacterium]